MSAFADSNIEKLRTSSSDEESEYYDAEGRRCSIVCNYVSGHCKLYCRYWVSFAVKQYIH